MFKVEWLKVYDKANELLDFIEGRLHRIGKEDRYSLGEQLKRASLAIPTNIAEATGRESPNKCFSQLSISPLKSNVPD